jgi:hypothetical protein
MNYCLRKLVEAITTPQGSFHEKVYCRTWLGSGNCGFKVRLGKLENIARQWRIKRTKPAGVANVDAFAIGPTLEYEPTREQQKGSSLVKDKLDGFAVVHGSVDVRHGMKQLLIGIDVFHSG